MQFRYRGLSSRFHLFFLSVLMSGVAIGQIKAPFALRYQSAVKGNMTLIANNVVSVSDTGSYNGTLGNHSVNMVFVDADSDTGTFNSCNATLALPSGLVCPVIKKAFLYWSAADMEDPGNEPDWDFNKVRLKVPGDTAYTTVMADQVIYQGRLEHFYNDPYACVKDITGMIPPDPAGTYWVANVKAKTGTLYSHGGSNTGCSGGWVIVFIYESNSLPQKNIAIFDGYVHVATEMVPNPLPFSFSGFQTVPTGNVNVDFLMGSIEGDWDLTGDYCQIQKVDGSWLTMSTPLRQTNNFFHSIIGLEGAQFLNRVPASRNTLGFDADKFAVANPGNTVIGNNQTSATIRMGTNQEIYGMFLVGLGVDIWYPEILTIFNIPGMPGGTGGSVNAGDTVTFSVEPVNNGNDGAHSLVLSTVIPPGLGFLQVIQPLPTGVVSGYNPATKVLSFSIADNLMEAGDTALHFFYKTRAITDCILLQDSATAHPVCQVTASYQGVVNPSPQVNQSSTGLSPCGIGNLAPVTFAIIPPPAVPVALDDSATTLEDMQAMIPVLANDTDCNHNINPAALTILSVPKHGTASVFYNTGNIVYTPALNYSGPDTLRYRICDLDNLCDSAVVFLTVIPVNDLPEVNNEYVFLCRGDSVSGNVLANDADTAENTPMTVHVPPAIPPAHGNVVLQPDGFFIYIPFAGYYGPDRFTVTVCDSGYPLPPLCLPDTVFINVEQWMQAVAGPDQEVCNAVSAILAGNSPLPGSAQWVEVSGPDTVTITSTGASTATVTGLIPGIYRFAYVINHGECSSSDTLTVQDDPPLPAAEAGPGQQLCLEDTGTATTHLHATPPVEGTGIWIQSQGPVTATFTDPADPETKVSGLSAGSYLFTWTVSKVPCPSRSDSMTIVVTPPAEAVAGDDAAVCGGTPFPVTGSSAANYASLHWVASGSGTFDDASLLHPVYAPSGGDMATGSVFLILTAISFQGCPAAIDTMVLSVSKPPTAEAGPDIHACNTLLIPLTGAAVTEAASLYWTHDGSGQLTGSTILAPIYTPAPGESGIVTFSLHATGSGVCSSLSVDDERSLTLYPPVTCDAGPDRSVKAGTAVTLAGSASSGSGDFSFEWQPADLFLNHYLPQPVTVPLDSSVTCYLTVTDISSGCSSADSVYITVTSTPAPPEEDCLEFHNAITPNGDGLNDTWIVDCIGNFPLNHLVIFDRWGDKIREMENYDNRSRVWNGTDTGGKAVADGTYFYVMSIRGGGTHTGWIFVRSGK